ncbi:hypothetical protein AC249_AIPGENE14010 [Exaiptasia diaphana]|nr:hypothetical protein AC249_AIPGENE14010 [Exaiptasia diaphana]
MSYENDKIPYEVVYVYDNRINKVCAILYRTQAGEYKPGRGCVVDQEKYSDSSETVKVVTETASCVTIIRYQWGEYKSSTCGFTIQNESVRVS